MLSLLVLATVLLPQADSTQYATQLRDVEVVGVKQLPDAPLQLETKISDAEIRRFNLDGIHGASELAPNVYIPSYGTRITSSIYVRGLGARIDQPVVGLNVDNVPYLNKDNYDFSLTDIQDIEILRGNSGVLNGRNAMAGQINIRTLSPWAYQGWRLGASYGRGNTAEISAGYYTQLSRVLATSLTAQFNTTDGFFRNLYNGDRCGTERQGGARWKMSWHPHTRWSVSNTASVTAGKQDGYPYQSVETGQIAYNDPMFYRRTSIADALTVSYTGKRMIATSISSFQFLDDNMTLDQDFLPADYFTLTQKRREWALTEDVFARGTRGIYSWLIGVFGFYKKNDTQAPVNFKDDGIARLIEGNVNSLLPNGMELRWDSRNLLLDSDFDIYNSGLALYHQSSIKVNNWTFQGGLRWDIERVRLHNISRCNTSASMGRIMPGGKWVPLATVPVDINDTDRLHDTYNQLLPQVSVQYAPLKQFSATFSVSKGYKAGGYNTQMLSDVLQQKLMEAMRAPAKYDVAEMLTYKPEVTWTHELTLRASTRDGRLNGTLTGFYIQCRNQQLTVFYEGLTGRAMTNAGRTRSAGLEITASYMPTTSLTFNASYGFTRATFQRYDDNKEDFKGKRLPYAPAHTLFIAGTFRMPVSILGCAPSLTLYTRGVGDIYWDDRNEYRQPFYALLGADLTFTGRLGSVSLQGKNLTNTHYSTFWFKSIGNAFTQVGDPWTLGAVVRINL